MARSRESHPHVPRRRAFLRLFLLLGALPLFGAGCDVWDNFLIGVGLQEEDVLYQQLPTPPPTPTTEPPSILEDLGKTFPDVGPIRTTPTPPSGTPPPATKRISVIRYRGLLLPVDQLRDSLGPECRDEEGEEEEHWHAKTGTVIPVAGTALRDPNPQGCGFGKYKDLPPFETDVPAK